MKRKASLLERELKQTQPFATPRQETVVALLYTSDLLRRRLSDVVEPRGVTLQQYNVLRILCSAEPEGVPTLEIAERMIERSPGITRLLDRLEKKGLVTRERGARDRRQVLCRVTPKATALLETMGKPVHDAGESYLATMTQRDLRAMLQILEKIRNSRA